jgi:hypothetical protein
MISIPMGFSGITDDEGTEAAAGRERRRLVVTVYSFDSPNAFA